MLNIPSLREARAQKVDAVRAIVSKAETEKRDLSDQEQSAFDVGKEEIEKLERDLRNGEFLAEAERRMQGTPVGNADNRFEAELQNFSLRKALLSECPITTKTAAASVN